MKIAILLLCHCAPKQINALTEAMSHPSITFFVHVDKKADIVKDIHTSERVTLMPESDRVDVRWGQVSQLDATLKLMQYASRGSAYDFYWLCSGQDFPIKSISMIVRRFE